MFKILPQYMNILKSINSSLHNRRIEDQLQFFCDQLVLDLSCSVVWIGLKEADGTIKMVAKAGEAAKYLETEEIRWDDSKLGQGAAGQAIRTGKVQYLDVRGNERYLLPWLQLLKRLKINTMLSLPIICKGNETVGALTIYCQDIQAFSEEKRAMLETIATQIALAIDMEYTNQLLSRYQLISEISRDIILLIDENGKIIEANKAALNTYGYSKEEILALNIFNLRADSKEHVQNQMNIALEDGILFETLHKKKDGQTFPVEVSSIGEKINGNKLLISIIRDISWRKNAEKRLFSSEEKYKELFDNMMDGVVIYQPDDQQEDFIIKEINKAAERIENIQRKDVQGQSVCDVFPGIKEFGLFDVLKKVHQTAQPEAFPVCEYSDERISGWRDNYIYKLSTGEIVAVYRDISSQKQAEEEIWLQKEKAEVTLKAIGDGVITTDVHGNIEYLNPTAEKLTKWTVDEARGLPLTKVFNIQNELTGEPAEDPVSRCLSLGRIVGLANHTILIDKQGQALPIEDSAAPIRDRKGTIVGAILVFYDVSDRRNMLDRLSYLATHDSLTDLPNRNYFSQQLKKNLKENKDKVFAIFFIDVDRFKFINDTYGHDIGDRLLKRISSRIKSQVGNDDIVCRYGGDEFAILINSTSEIEGILSLGSKLISRCSERFLINGYELYISLSMGIAVYPQNGQDVNSLLKHADIAMYSAKKNGGNKFHVYVSEEDARPFKNFSMLSKLNKALDKNEFELHYQPQMGLEQGQIVGVEALLRWNSSSGMIKPMDFIPLAEETGLIVPIGEWVLRTACAQNKKWQEEGYRPLEISVNISARQFYNSSFIKHVVDVLTNTGLASEWLNLEITETIAMQDFALASSIITRLHKIGVKITIDDFGTGYSSLNYLANLELNYLKLDKSLIENLHDRRKKRNVTRAILSLAQSLELKVVAEGVEKEEELDYLRQLRCDMVQGFLISKPLPISEAHLWLN